MRRQPPVKAEPNAASKPREALGGLLSPPSDTHVSDFKSFSANSPDLWAEAHARIRDLSSVYWLQRQPSYLALAEQLKRQAARTGGAFASPDAHLRLIQGVLISLLMYRTYKVRPEQLVSH